MQIIQILYSTISAKKGLRYTAREKNRATETGELSCDAGFGFGAGCFLHFPHVK